MKFFSLQSDTSSSSKEGSLSEMLQNACFAEESFRIVLEDALRLSETADAITTLIEQKKKGEPISMESYRHVANMAVAAGTTPGAMLLDPSMSMEALASHRDGLFNKITHAFSTLGTQLLDMDHHWLSVLEFQSSRLDDARLRLNTHPRDQGVVQVPVSKYLRHGHSKQVVADGKEYSKLFGQTSAALTALCHGMARISDKDMFGYFKWVVSIITASRDEFREKRIRVLDSVVDNVRKAVPVKKEKTVGQWDAIFDILATDVLLGVFQIELHVPQSEESSLYGPFIHLERMQKLELPSFMHNDISLEFRKSDIDALLKQAESMVMSANELSNITRRLATLMNRLSFLAMFTPVVLATYPALVSKSGTVMLRIWGVIFSCMSGSYNLAFGNAKTAAKISEKWMKL